MRARLLQQQAEGVCCPHCNMTIFFNRVKGAGLDLVPMDVISTIAKIHKLTASELTGKGRQRHIISARFTAIWIIRFELKDRLSVGRIGQIFNRDHASIVHACNSVKDWKDTDPEYDSHLTSIINHLKLQDATQVRS